MTDELKQWEYDKGYSDGRASLIEELEKIKSEMQDYGCSFIIAKRSDLASVVSNCIRMVDKHISEPKGE